MGLFRSHDGHQRLDDERPAKRISTPAGQRLSLIIEPTHVKRNKSPAAKINVTTTSTYCNDPTHLHVAPEEHTPKKRGVESALTGARLNTPRESGEDHGPNGSNFSVSVWSDKEEEKFGHIRQNARWRTGAWVGRRIIVIAAILFILVIALSIGLAVGLAKKSSSSSKPTTTSDNAQPGDSTTDSGKPSSPSSTSASGALPPGFPAGSFSFVTFLDTVTAECTSNNATWACPPDTNYYANPQKALAILNWEISGSSGAYKISSKGQDATFGTSFQNEKLELLDAGKDTERYRFQINRAKAVSMTGSIGDASGDFECDYGATNIQGFLYTKFAKTYPKDTISVGNTGDPSWPFAVRVEQTVAGGQNVPSCKKKSGEQVSLKGQDASTLCSCLYKNWTPAK